MERRFPSRLSATLPHHIVLPAQPVVAEYNHYWSARLCQGLVVIYQGFFRVIHCADGVGVSGGTCNVLRCVTSMYMSLLLHRLFSCPQLIASDPTLTLLFNVDPTYYTYSFCNCERGYTSGGLPPNCAAFPATVGLNSSASGVFSDGSSSGRLRTGTDS